MSALSIHQNIRVHSLTFYMHPQVVKLLLYCSDVMIIRVNCIANEQVSNLAMIMIQTVNNIKMNSYVCTKYGNNLSVRTNQG